MNALTIYFRKNGPADVVYVVSGGTEYIEVKGSVMDSAAIVCQSIPAASEMGLFVETVPFAFLQEH